MSKPEISWLADRFGAAGGGAATLSERYLAAVYFTVTTITTTGYGDIVATNERE